MRITGSKKNSNRRGKTKERHITQYMKWKAVEGHEMIKIKLARQSKQPTETSYVLRYVTEKDASSFHISMSISILHAWTRPWRGLIKFLGMFRKGTVSSLTKIPFSLVWPFVNGFINDVVTTTECNHCLWNIKETGRQLNPPDFQFIDNTQCLRLQKRF